MLLEVQLVLPRDPLTPGQIQLPIQNIGNAPLLFDRRIMILAIFRRRLGEQWRDYNIVDRDESHGTSLGTITGPRLTIFLTRRTLSGINLALLTYCLGLY